MAGNEAPSLRNHSFLNYNVEPDQVLWKDRVGELTDSVFPEGLGHLKNSQDRSMV